MNVIDKTTQTHLTIGLYQALIGSASFGAMLHKAEAEGRRVEEVVGDLATSFANAAITQIEKQNIISVPHNSVLSDALMLYIEGVMSPGRMEFEDRLQEGELASNAAALLLQEPERWVPDSQSGGEAPFPGTGDNDGQGRINDLIRAAAYVLAELGRLERAENTKAAYAAAAAERGVAVPPPGTEDEPAPRLN